MAISAVLALGACCPRACVRPLCCSRVPPPCCAFPGHCCRLVGRAGTGGAGCFRPSSSLPWAAQPKNFFGNPRALWPFFRSTSAWRLDAESPFRAVEPCWLAFRSKKRSCLSPATFRSICFDLIPASSIESFFTLFIHEHDCNHRRLRTPAESSETHPHRHLRDS